MKVWNPGVSALQGKDFVQQYLVQTLDGRTDSQTRETSEDIRKNEPIGVIATLSTPFTTQEDGSTSDVYSLRFSSDSQAGCCDKELQWLSQSIRLRTGRGAY